MQIFKFGGASIQNAAAFQQLGKIIQAAQPSPLVIVISAIGTTTKRLEAMLQQKASGTAHATALQTLGQFHQNIIEQLLVTRRHEALRTLAAWQGQLAATLALPVADGGQSLLYSKVVAMGELLASRLVHYYLQEQGEACVWLDARTCIKTHHGCCNAQVDWGATQRLVKKEIQPRLKKGQVVLTQGFIGSNEANETTTLGKEGSDFSGAILAAALGAQSLTVWKDVPGVMSADPKVLQGATKFTALSYTAMAAMAHYGARVMHPRTLQPLAEHNIPLYVKPFHHPQEAGTRISHGPAQPAQPVYILQKDQGLLELRLLGGAFFDEEQCKKALRQFSQQQGQINLLAKSACTMSLCLSATPCQEKTWLEAFSPHFQVNYHTPVSLLTVLRQAGTLPPELLAGQTVLLAQQRPGLYQAVLQQASKKGK